MNNYERESLRRLSLFDRLLAIAARGLADATTTSAPTRPMPVPRGVPAAADEVLDEGARLHAGGLMRVNHVGEICAQALYEGHALTVRDDRLSSFFLAAADEERDHLAWTRQRLRELDANPSLLNPVWYLGSLSMGALAGLAGGPRALGFMAETERQVEAHLQGHLQRLPENDLRSRAIVEEMKADEARHADEARSKGATPMSWPVVGAMRLMSKVMTTLAYRI
jgi:3-demethoxyubiquinol 3-hydroxylase